MKSKYLIFFQLCFLISCSTNQQRKFESALNNGKCEEALENIPKNDSSSFLKSTKQISGSIASYTLTGLTYGTEVSVYIVGGIAGNLVVCSPVIAAEVSTKSNGSFSAECFRFVSERLFRGISDEDLYGKKVFDKTASWRCPDLTDISVGLRAVASCYEDKDNVEGFRKAKEQLELIRNEDFQSLCVNNDERMKIEEQYNRIQNKLVFK